MVTDSRSSPTSQRVQQQRQRLCFGGRWRRDELRTGVGCVVLLGAHEATTTQSRIYVGTVLFHRGTARVGRRVFPTVIQMRYFPTFWPWFVCCHNNQYESNNDKRISGDISRKHTGTVGGSQSTRLVRYGTDGTSYTYSCWTVDRSIRQHIDTSSRCIATIGGSGKRLIPRRFWTLSFETMWWPLGLWPLLRWPRQPILRKYIIRGNNTCMFLRKMGHRMCLILSSVRFFTRGPLVQLMTDAMKYHRICLCCPADFLTD